MLEDDDFLDDADADTLSMWEEEGDAEVDALSFFQASAKDAQIIGHLDIIQHLEQLAEQQKMPHALLFSGTKGIGKALVANKCAHMLLAGVSRMEVKHDHPIMAQMQAGSLAEYLYISGENREDEGKEKASLIDIEMIRGISQVLSLTRSSCPYRVIVIDGAEDMNQNAANALLKNLEEPPAQTVFILISHNAAKLLPTIRSRCRTLHFKPLSIEECSEVLAMHANVSDREMVERVAMLANASPGLALQWLNAGGYEIYENICQLFAETREEHEELRQIGAFLDGVLSNRAVIHSTFKVLVGLLLALISHAALPSLQPISEAEQKALQHFRQNFLPKQLTELWFDVSEQFSIAQGLHLDYRNALTTLLVRLARGKEPLPLKP